MAVEEQQESGAQGNTNAADETQQPGTTEEQAQGDDNFLTDKGATDGDSQEENAEGDETQDQQDNFLSDNEKDTDGETNDENAEDSGQGVPESYEFTMPEGMTEDTELTAAVSPVLKELGISQEDAQKLVDVYAPHMQQLASSAVENFIQQQNDLVAQDTQQNREAVMAMPDRETVIGHAKEAMKFFAQSPEELAYLEEDGNNPVWLKMLSRLGEQVGEGKFVEGDGGGVCNPLDDIYDKM